MERTMTDIVIIGEEVHAAATTVCTNLANAIRNSQATLDSSSKVK